MGIAEILTIIFIILKVTETIDWSWWVVLLPEIIAVSIYLILMILWLVAFIVSIIKIRV